VEGVNRITNIVSVRSTNIVSINVYAISQILLYEKKYASGCDCMNKVVGSNGKKAFTSRVVDNLMMQISHIT
jgi:hypothetical protein